MGAGAKPRLNLLARLAETLICHGLVAKTGNRILRARLFTRTEPIQPIAIEQQRT